MKNRLSFRAAHIFGGAFWVACLLLWPVLTGWHGALTLLLAVLSLLLWWRTRATLRMPASACVAFLMGLIWLLSLEPRGDRDWNTETSVLPRISIVGDRVLIKGLRDFRWNEKGEFEARWIDRELDLKDLQELELMVEPFGDSERLAHTLLCFGFGSERIAVSVEARKEAGEDYGLIRGALRQFELIYVFAAERDLLTLRAVSRGDRVYLFPVRADAAFIRKLFVDLAASANAQHTEPQFYRTFRDNCTTTLVEHFDRRLEKKVGPRLEVLFPARAGALVHELGYMHTELSYEEARPRYQLRERIRRYADDPDFSRRIRAGEVDGS